MKIDRRHLPWAIFVAIATVLCAALYLAEFHPRYMPFDLKLPRFMSEAPRERNSYGASPLGLFYGVLALAIFLFASALGIRKKRRLWPIGNVQLWLRAHIWLTILTIPLVAFHSGFQLGGAHTTTVMILYAIVMISGFVGLALQNIVPRYMKDSLAREIVYEQIPHIRRRIVDEAATFRRDFAEKVKASKAVPVEATEDGGLALAIDDSEAVLLEFLSEECLPYILASRANATRMRLANKKSSDDAFRLLRLNVSENFRSRVEEMQSWCDDRRLMDLQTKLHHWMHGWLLVHVPLSFALLIFTFWHAYVTWFYL